MYDVSNPYHIEETGYYVPGAPKAQYNPNGPLYWGSTRKTSGWTRRV